MKKARSSKKICIIITKEEVAVAVNAAHHPTRDPLPISRDMAEPMARVSGIVKRALLKVALFHIHLAKMTARIISHNGKRGKTNHAVATAIASTLRTIGMSSSPT